MSKGRWPVSWLRRWDKKQEKEAREEYARRVADEDPRRDGTGRLLPLIEDEDA